VQPRVVCGQHRAAVATIRLRVLWAQILSASSAGRILRPALFGWECHNHGGPIHAGAKPRHVHCAFMPTAFEALVHECPSKGRSNARGLWTLCKKGDSPCAALSCANFSTPSPWSDALPSLRPRLKSLSQTRSPQTKEDAHERFEWMSQVRNRLQRQQQRRDSAAYLAKPACVRTALYNQRALHLGHVCQIDRHVYWPYCVQAGGARKLRC
jgi:hypothetical protein